MLESYENGITIMAKIPLEIRIKFRIGLYLADLQVTLDMES